MARISYDEETDYGQDVLELIALCVTLQESGMTMTQIRKQLYKIHGQLNHIASNIFTGNEEYWIIGGKADGFSFTN